MGWTLAEPAVLGLEDGTVFHGLSIGSPGETPVAPAVGKVETTVGGVTSGTDVVKDQT